MKLATYLSAHNISTADFAAKLGLSEVSVTRYAAGTRIPRRHHMLAISKATCGEVSPNDFFGVEPASSASQTEAAA